MASTFFTTLLGPICEVCGLRPVGFAALCPRCENMLEAQTSQMNTLPRHELLVSGHQKVPVCSLGFYEHGWGSLVAAAKSRPSATLVEPLAQLVARHCPALWKTYPLFAVPTSPWRALHINELLLLKLKNKGFYVTTPNPLRVEPFSFLRKNQKGVSGKERVSRHLPFRLKSPAPGPVLLFDDIVTTGATLAQCARLLLTAGYGPVVIFTLAVTPYKTNPLDASPLLAKQK